MEVGDVDAGQGYSEDRDADKCNTEAHDIAQWSWSKTGGVSLPCHWGGPVEVVKLSASTWSLLTPYHTQLNTQVTKEALQVSRASKMERDQIQLKKSEVQAMCALLLGSHIEDWRSVWRYQGLVM